MLQFYSKRRRIFCKPTWGMKGGTWWKITRLGGHGTKIVKCLQSKNDDEYLVVRRQPTLNNRITAARRVFGGCCAFFWNSSNCNPLCSSSSFCRLQRTTTISLRSTRFWMFAAFWLALPLNLDMWQEISSKKLELTYILLNRWKVVYLLRTILQKEVTYKNQKLFPMPNVRTYIFHGILKRCFSTLLVMGMLQCFVLEVVSSWSAKRTLIDYACSRIKATKAVKTGMCTTTTEALKKARLRGWKTSATERECALWKLKI